MRGLKPYQASTLDFHKKVISKKRDATLRTRVSSHEPAIATLFNDYDQAFSTGGLTHMIRYTGFNPGDVEDFNEMYRFGSKPMQDLRTLLTTVEYNLECNTCQNCTIGEVNSFDHVLPQAEFPEFIINPKNLFPSCSTCNSHKSDVWRTGVVANFLNLYLDTLPQLQYLFVDLTVSPDPNGLIETHFEVRNTAGIEINLYNRIWSHYDRLHLCKRFSQNNHTPIIELINSFKTGDKNEARTQAINTCNESRKTLGFNHWKDILKLELANNVDFLARFP